MLVQFEWDAEKAQIKGNTEAIFVDMMTIPMTVPSAMAPYLDDKEQDHSFERNAMMLYPFIRNLTISHGRAAEILGVHKFDLIDYYCSIGLPYLNQSLSDLAEEMEDIRHFEEAGE